MKKEDFLTVIKALEMTTPQVASFLKVAQNTVSNWRAASGPDPSGPVEVALRFECERRSIQWPMNED
jgi:DNA-binding transcriptional regulator YiaG